VTPERALYEGECEVLYLPPDRGAGIGAGSRLALPWRAERQGWGWASMSAGGEDKPRSQRRLWMRGSASHSQCSVGTNPEVASTIERSGMTKVRADPGGGGHVDGATQGALKMIFATVPLNLILLPSMIVQLVVFLVSLNQWDRRRLCPYCGYRRRNPDDSVCPKCGRGGRKRRSRVGRALHRLRVRSAR
jgi:hypothetical protein